MSVSFKLKLFISNDKKYCITIFTAIFQKIQEFIHSVCKIFSWNNLFYNLYKVNLEGAPEKFWRALRNEFYGTDNMIGLQWFHAENSLCNAALTLQ